MIRATLALALVAVLSGSANATTTQRSVRCNSGTYNYAHTNAPCVWNGTHNHTRSYLTNRYADFWWIRDERAACMLRAHSPGSCPGGKS